MTFKQNNGVTRYLTTLFGDKTSLNLAQNIEHFAQYNGKAHPLAYAILDYMNKAQTGRRTVKDILEQDYAGEYPSKPIFACAWLDYACITFWKTELASRYLFDWQTSQPKFYFIESQDSGHVFRPQLNKQEHEYANEVEEVLHQYGHLQKRRLGELLDDIEAGEKPVPEHKFERTFSLMDAVYHQLDYCPDDWTVTDAISNQYESYWEGNESDYAELKAKLILQEHDFGDYDYIRKYVDYDAMASEMFTNTLNMHNFYIFKQDI